MTQTVFELTMKNIHNLIQTTARHKSQSDQHLRKLLCSQLDAALIKQIEFIQIESQVLKLSVQSSTWASRIRFFGDEILRVVQNANIPARKVKVSIHAMPKSRELLRSSTRTASPIQGEALKNLEDIAGEMNDNELKASISRLISNARTRNKR